MSTKKIKKDKNSEYNLLYTQIRKSLTDEDNKDQIIFLCRKIQDSNKLLEKLSSKANATPTQTRIGKVYIFIYYYRLLDINQKLADDSIETIEEIVTIQTDFVRKASKHFGLDEKDIHEMLKAFKDVAEPVGKKTPLGIKLGHDVILSSLAQSKITKTLENLFTEFNFYFPHLSPHIGINNHLIDYISKSKFYTQYSVENYLSKKVKNKAKLIKHIQKQKSGASILNNKHAMTMIKTSSRNQVDIVSIADKKAGIMITVNSILLTLLIPMFASYIFDFSSFIIPISILIVTNGLTILLATLATRPSMVAKDELTSEKIHTGQKSVFYFKNFATLSKADFVHEAKEILTKDSAFEQSVFTDLYDVGIDLDRKYKRLRWCYTIFGTGILLTMLSFVVVIIFSSL
ncbi:DUF5706 domain-containing protein [Saprospiraceae bacterium]|nr:DUF5706 domain-containing protein [Saprospiraceae bacterium]